MKRILCSLILLMIVPISCQPKDEFRNKTKRDFIHSKYLDATLKYLNGVVYQYPCQLNLPPMPKITVARTNEIDLYCPQGARACYQPFTNHAYYEEGDYEALKHELAHAILHYNVVAQQCIQELIIQQMDFIARDSFDGKRGRFSKLNQLGEGQRPSSESRL